MKKIIMLLTILSILWTWLPSGSYSFLTLNKDSKTKGFVIVNSTKYQMKVVSYPQTTLKPNGGLSVKSTNDAYLFSWLLTSETEPFFTHVISHWMPTTKANKLVVKDLNTGLDGYPWTLTKTGNIDKLVFTFSSNLCTSGVLGFYDSTDEKIRFTMPCQYYLVAKNYAGKAIRLTFWKGHRFFSTSIAFPKGFKGGSYKLSLNVKSTNQVLINMTNDEKQNLKLTGCPSLANIFIGDYTKIAHSSNTIPSEYDGKFFGSDVIKNNTPRIVVYHDLALSPKFSYNINFDTQANGVFFDGNVYCKTSPSVITKVVLDPASSSSAVIDVFDQRTHKFTFKNLKTWETTEDPSLFLVFVRFPTSEYQGMSVNLGKMTETTILACQDEVFGQKFVYQTKGFQFFQDRDYFVSGLDVVTGNPYKKFDGVDYINTNAIIRELGATDIEETPDKLSFKLVIASNTNPYTFEITKDAIIIRYSKMYMKVSIIPKIVDSKFFCTVKSLADVFGFKSKAYPSMKSLCLTMNQK